MEEDFKTLTAQGPLVSESEVSIFFKGIYFLSLGSNQGQ